MKYFLTLVSLLSLQIFTNAQTVPNSSFELVNPDTSFQQWTNTGVVLVNIGDSIIFDGNPIERSIISNTGSYALQLNTSWNYTQNAPNSSIALSIDNDNTASFPATDYLPLATKPFNWSFYYKFITNTHADTLYATTNILNSSFIVIGSAKAKLWQVNESYVQKVTNITYNYVNADTTPAYANIFFKLNNENSTNVNGPKVLIDDVTMSSVPLKINNLYSNSFYISPNPVNQILTINADSPSNIDLGVYTSTGTRVIHSIGKNKIDVSHLPNGLYFLVAKEESDIISFKFCKE